MKPPKPGEKTPREWTQRAKPAEGGRRTRRIGLIFLPEVADRLVTLARLDGVSVNHEAERMVNAEYSRRLTDENAAKIIAALEKLTSTEMEIKGDDGKTVYKGPMLTAKINEGKK